MIDKNHLCSVNNYCKTSHTMTVRGKPEASSLGIYTKYLKCIEEAFFEIERINPDFMYNKWLTKE